MICQQKVPQLFDEIQRLFAPVSFQTDLTGLSLYENDDFVFVEAAVPGISIDNIQISVEKNIVWIRAEEPVENKEMKVHFQTLRKYSYRLPLPARIDEQAAPEAICKDGVLKIAFAKSRASRPVKIQVKAA